MYTKEERRQYNEKNRGDIRAYQNNLRARYRGLVIEALGRKCAHCGFNDPRALQVDQIKEEGYRARKPGGTATYWKRALEEIQAGSNRYRLFCANCNWIKRHENGEHIKDETQQ